MAIKFYMQVSGRPGTPFAFYRQIAEVVFATGEYPASKEDAEFAINAIRQRHGHNFEYKLLPVNHAKNQRKFDFEQQSKTVKYLAFYGGKKVSVDMEAIGANTLFTFTPNPWLQ